jgi:hypothetical protein
MEVVLRGLSLPLISFLRMYPYTPCLGKKSFVAWPSTWGSGLGRALFVRGLLLVGLLHPPHMGLGLSASCSLVCPPPSCPLTPRPAHPEPQRGAQAHGS